jgi:arylsulfatase A-like enzyme
MDQPNVLFIMADQYRADAVGADLRTPVDTAGDPVLETPALNRLAGDGTLCSRAYTPSPLCVPARRCLWTGQTPATNGCVDGNTPDRWDFEATLPAELGAAGYQTHLAGKSHSQPLYRKQGITDHRTARHRTTFGFDSMDLHVGSSVYTDDYSTWIADRRDDDHRSHGLSGCFSGARPWHLDEEEHPTNWTARRALEFLRRRDPDRPFFLALSFVRPHAPLDPPAAYLDQYIDRDLPDPPVGDWVDECHDVPTWPETTSHLADMPTASEHRRRAAYYALCTHIDAQINRVLRALRWAHGVLDDTIVVFTSDHGEMLGDHHHWHKRQAYEGSARVPLLLDIPDRIAASHGIDPVDVVDAPVGLEDLMPTLLDLCGSTTPDGVEGRSLLPLVDGQSTADADWRTYYHGELGPYEPENQNATQYLVSQDHKYVWFPATGEELLFDLERDPQEETNVVSNPEYAEVAATFRSELVDRLRDRTEGFVSNETLTALDEAV